MPKILLVSFFSRTRCVITPRDVAAGRVQELYDVSMVDEDGQAAGWTAALQTAVTSIALLWSMRAGRNITAIPFAVSIDTDSDGWFSAPTLYQSSVYRHTH